MRRRTDTSYGITHLAFFVLYLCATLQFVRFYAQNTIFYLNLHSYLTGHERLPFQERVLPIFFIRPLMQSEWVARHLVHQNGIYTAERGPFYLLSLLSLLIAGIFVQKLYQEVTQSKALSAVVYPLFLFDVIWSYSIHNEANFSYPYDFASVAFFVAGLYFIYTRRFLWLTSVILIGTLNRETTLFLIGIYIIDAASVSAEEQLPLRERFSPKQIPWLRAGLLFAIWLSEKLVLAHIFSHNDRSENYNRILYNIGCLKPRLWPALLNVCGYTLPLVFLFRGKLHPIRFANYLYIFPLWFAVMFYTGVIVETRVYGELCSFAAISLVLILERYIVELAGTRSLAAVPTRLSQS